MVSMVDEHALVTVRAIQVGLDDPSTRCKIQKHTRGGYSSSSSKKGQCQTHLDVQKGKTMVARLCWEAKHETRLHASGLGHTCVATLTTSSVAHSLIMDWAELDLAPPYPTPASLYQQFSSKVLSIDQRRALSNHSLARACLFADLTLLTFLVNDATAKFLVDLTAKDEDGLGLVSQSILGFGEELERNVDREECIRLLILRGAPVDETDLCEHVISLDAALVDLTAGSIT